jgi:hypothetical protein
MYCRSNGIVVGVAAFIRMGEYVIRTQTLEQRGKAARM